MTYKDFEDHIDARIAERGLDYFEGNHVDNLEKVASGLWMAQVYGTETYTVEVLTHRTQIKSWDCNCPYDHGPVCKHAVAVLYAIAEEMGSGKKQPQKKGNGKKAPKKDKVKEILKKTGKKDLEGFILAQFRQQQGLKNAFLAHFSDLLDEDLDTKYRTLVRNIYKSAKGRAGYIDYRSTSRLVNPLHELLKKAQSSFSEKNYREALVISQTLMEEVPIFILNMDDSNGSAGFLVDSAFEIFHQIAEEAPPMLKDELFDYSIGEYPKEKYHNFGFQRNFLETLPVLITLKEQEDRFFKLLDEQIKEAKNDRYSNYRSIGLIKTKIDYLERAKRKDEADALLEEHKFYADFRKILVDRAIAKKNFERAKSLCSEGIAIAKEKRHLGHVNAWYNKLLLIAQKQKHVADVRKWAEKLYFDSHYQKEYYKTLKATYSKEEWNKVYEALIKKITGGRTHGSYGMATALADIFTAEEQWPRLLKQLQLNSTSASMLDAYSKYLVDTYPQEIMMAYEKAVTDMAKDTGRSIYNEVAKYLKKMQKMKGGEETVKRLLQFFRETYKNRRAMMEVLNKKFRE